MACARARRALEVLHAHWDLSEHIHFNRTSIFLVRYACTHAQLRAAAHACKDDIAVVMIVIMIMIAIAIS
jgi:hypothetical protein